MKLIQDAKLSESVLGIEPDDHQTRVFSGNTAITLISQKTPRAPILSMPQCFQGNWGELWD